jgi:hypothetical protein
MRTWIIVTGIIIGSYSSSVRADDYKDARDAAYCVGVSKNYIAYWAKLHDLSEDIVAAFLVAAIRDAEQKQARNETLIDGAIKLGKVDLVTATKMMDAGFADANLCDQKMIKCKEEYGSRVQKNVATALNIAQFANCMKGVEPVCERVYKKCE